MNNKITLSINDIDIVLTRKAIKNINLRVLPPYAEVQVSAPKRTSLLKIRQFVCSRETWIKQAQQEILARPQLKKSSLLDGDEVFLKGQSIQLQWLVSNRRKSYAQLEQNAISLYLIEADQDEQDGLAQCHRDKILGAVYRDYLTPTIALLMKKWQPIVGVTCSDWRIKKMKTKWGSCNITARRIWLNLELAQYSYQCLEYVLVHELVHLHERYHNARFYAYMDHFLPEWKTLKKQLNRGLVLPV